MRSALLALSALLTALVALGAPGSSGGAQDLGPEQLPVGPDSDEAQLLQVSLLQGPLSWSSKRPSRRSALQTEAEAGDEGSPWLLDGEAALGALEASRVEDPPAPTPALAASLGPEAASGLLAYNESFARAFASLAQAAQCGADARLRRWQCKACRKVGFDLVPGTSRLIRQQEFLAKGATFVNVARLRWLSPGPESERIYRSAPREPLAHTGEDCHSPCGGGGYCAWCGIGNACCSQGGGNLAECRAATGFVSGGPEYQCAAPSSEPLPPAPVQNAGENCWLPCGQAGGFCPYCGAGNACCRSGYDEDPLECRNASGGSHWHHACTAPGPSVPAPGPLDFGCSVAVRGSKNLANDLNDMFFWSTEFRSGGCNDCRVATGWANVWRGVEEKVVRSLVDNGCTPGGPRGSLLITGHSLGAAVATLAMFSLQARGYTVQLSYNFESPRVGNEAFAAAFKEWFGRKPALYRVTREKDPVPHVPPQPLAWHAGAEAYYPAKGADPVICEEAEDEKCANRYMLTETITHTDDHCHAELVASGDLCKCDLARA